MTGHTGLYHNTLVAQLAAPAVRTAVANSGSLDLANYDAASLIFDIGTPGDTLSGSNRIELQVQESADNSTWTAVADTDLTKTVTGGVATGTVAVIIASGGAAGIYYTGYKGNLRYIRGVLNYVGTHTNGTPSSVTGLAGRPRLAPVNA